MLRKAVLGFLGLAGLILVLASGLYLHDALVGQRTWHLIAEDPDGTARELGHSLTLDQCEEAALLNSQRDTDLDIEAVFDDVVAKIRCAISSDPAGCERKSPGSRPEKLYRCGYRCHWGEGTACLFKRKGIRR